MLYSGLFHFEQPTPPSPEACSEIADTAEAARISRVVEGLGSFVSRMDDSGVTTLLIGGTAAWPGPVATASRAVIHVTQTVGTYHRVLRAGFTSKDALAKTVWWTIAGR